jgi:hypothetical protein
MKKIIMISALMVSTAIAANAQVNVNVNIGMQPAWGPVGYDYVRYYYLPDADAYYDVNSRVFVVFANGAWVRRSALPRPVDLYRVHKIVINDAQPWRRHTVYHDRYITYRGRPSNVVVIRDSKEPKYMRGNNGNANGHYKQRGGDNGRGHGNGGGRGQSKGHGGGHGRGR